MIYSWGLNEDGQCNVEPEEDQCIQIPKQINLPEVITSISAGSRHTLFHNSTSGKVFSVGWGQVRYICSLIITFH